MSDVPVGYKQTDVGVIPEDWEVKSIYQLSRPVRGGSPRPAGSPKYFNGSFIPWLTVAALTNISSSQIEVIETASFLTEEGSLHSRILNKGTLIIANSGATLGVAKILGVKCCANDGIAALLDIPKNVNPFYLTYYLNTKTNHLRDVIATGNGQPNLNTELIGNIEIPLPPTLTEQTAIATALSDVDALLNQLDKLIAKKRDIKQATMQQLLTGNKRLAGFGDGKGYKQTEIGEIPEDWEVKELKDILLQFQNGYAFSGKGYVGAGVPIITMAQIGLDGAFQFNEERVNYWPKTYFNKLQSYHVNNGDVLIAMTDVTPDKNLIGRMSIAKLSLTALLNQRVGLLKLNLEKINPIFLVSYSHQTKWRAYCKGVASLGVQANIGTSDLKNGLITLPPLEEQTAIATLLTDMDTEITQLQQRRHKTHALKQGMMQQLLTGKIRLVAQ